MKVRHITGHQTQQQRPPMSLAWQAHIPKTLQFTLGGHDEGIDPGPQLGQLVPDVLQQNLHTGQGDEDRDGGGTLFSSLAKKGVPQRVAIRRYCA